ncbi:tRNA dihydrouridine synthase DusB [Candidatus Epulonipiscium fishelsonii]|uniref:tRNA dihydrouridine synthase DusB n=1 Tax=Candidatus Epulonipiscium fishelsonii TaxID=77094 RepID=A0ACC8XFV9_9FIRM|nr:tRNA dihydrouridine synthase DusB [Epulopiscium sp. SCG-B11WGA-EpuloA1]ONI42961.1 tRNA dihydrouridine synthase DusB [Epulopiscium sp. SCG-B05WGA-EpuloA1]
MKFGNITTQNNVFLAPMAGITDISFRKICKQFGCGLMYTEMVSAKGLFYNNDKTSDLLKVEDIEHPIGAQLFGSDPKLVSEMAKRVEQMDVDFIDINMGCPALKIIKNGEGSALLKNPELIGEIVYAIVKSIKKPLTIKIRKGFSEEDINAVKVSKIIEQAGASAITLHGRSREQFYSGNADWNIIKEVKQNINIPLIGNGDVKTAIDAKRMLEYTGCDAVMIGRAAQGNPWIFEQTVHYLKTGELLCEPTFDEKVKVILEHANNLLNYQGEIGIIQMRNHLVSYIKGVYGASSFRKELTSVKTIDDIKYKMEQIQNYLNNL